jgi:hypothetical protein
MDAAHACLVLLLEGLLPLCGTQPRAAAAERCLGSRSQRLGSRHPGVSGLPGLLSRLG